MGMTLSYPSVLGAHAVTRPHHPAVIDRAGLTLDYEQLVEAGARFATLLRQHGVQRGDRVGILQQMSAPLIVSVLGTMLAGGVVTPLHAGLTDQELRRYLEPIEASIVVTDHTMASRAGALGLPVLDVPLAMTVADFLGSLPAGILGPGLAAEDDPAFVFPTGGTTGLPKGSVLTHRATWLWVSHLGHAYRRRTDVELALSPPFHVTLLAGPLSTLFAGGTVRTMPGFDLEGALDAIEEGANTMAAPPTVYRRLLASPRFVELAPRMTRLVYGATASGPEFAREMLAAFPAADISTGYGATEFGTVTKLLRSDLDAGRLTGVGRPVPGVLVQVVDEDLRAVPPGTVGEVMVSAPWQARWYWGLPGETQATFTSAGVRLGDVGVFDDDGWLTLCGRTKEMIISGGENIFPAEVEAVLAAHPAIAEVAVYGVPDDEWGERVEAAVVIRNEAPFDADDVLRFASRSLGRFKLPKTLLEVPQLPMTANNKPDRRALVRRASSPDGAA